MMSPAPIRDASPWEGTKPLPVTPRGSSQLESIAPAFYRCLRLDLLKLTQSTGALVRPDYKQAIRRGSV